MRMPLILIIFSTSFWLAGCNLENSNIAQSGNLQAWFDAPLTGSEFPLGPIEVIAHGASPGGVAQLELNVDGDLYETTIPDPYSAQGEATILAKTSWLWYPTLPGQYTLTVRAQSVDSVWSPYAATTIIVLPLVLPDPDIAVVETPLTVDPTQTPTPTITPTPTPTPTTQLTSINNAGLSSSQVFYGGTSCDPQQATFNAVAMHTGSVTAVIFFYRLEDQESGETTGWSSGQAMLPTGNGYSLTLTGDQLARPMAYSGNNATVRYQFALQPSQGSIIRSPVYGDLTLTRCIGTFFFPGFFDTPTPTLVIPR